jgi:TPR repeat protein
VRRRITTLVGSGLLALALFGVAIARPLEDVLSAFQRGDYAAALQILRPLAEHGDALAQAGLGVMYANGQGVPQDDVQALLWFRKAADQGNTDAQFNLGVMYANGQGVPRDYTQALVWFRKAADQGNTDARFNLGVMYANGQGVPQDYVSAHMWFNLAASGASAASDHDQSVKYRDLVAADMTAAQIAEAQRMARESKPK